MKVKVRLNFSCRITDQRIEIRMKVKLLLNFSCVWTVDLSNFGQQVNKKRRLIMFQQMNKSADELNNC
ncbi:hypothetical protein HanOQP8_Chr04g0162681 [Helianthus annuus]|nr:hypothetical protein HanOQP8_Chr04g0162681 [Helianthus annuus]